MLSLRRKDVTGGVDLLSEGLGAISWVNQRAQGLQVKECFAKLEAKSGGVRGQASQLCVFFHPHPPASKDQQD